MDWLSFFVCTFILSCGISIPVSLAIVDPKGVKRIARSLKAHIPRSIAERRLRKLDLDMVAQLSVEVDMDWWDEQFKKLTRATYRRDPELVSHVEGGGNGANWIGWMDNSTAEILSMTQGDITFRMSHLTPAEQTQVESTFAMKQRQYADAMQAMSYEPGIPALKRIDVATKISAAQTPTETDRALEEFRMVMHRAKTERLTKEAADADCENCGYVEERTYADSKWIKRKTYECNDCREETFDGGEIYRLRGTENVAAAFNQGVVSRDEAISRIAQIWA